MSKRRRPKKRSPMQQQRPVSPPPPPAQEPVIENRYRPDRSSGLSSEEGTASELASDGVLTAMTSLPASEDGLVTSSGVPSAQSFGNDDEDTDLQSVYIGSMYPQVPAMFRAELPYVGAESHTVNDDIAASTRSLWAQDLDYREMHGRLYCREFYQPIDDLEQMRWSLIHHVFQHVLGGELTTIPLDNPKHILDVGTGTGEWAIKMAELFPQCEVMGTDIAAIAETQSIPMNVFFEIEDAEDWDRSTNLYDMIHLRSMDGAFKDWRYIYDHAFASLKPGGWIEVLDVDGDVADAFPADSTFRLMCRELDIAAEKSGRRRGIHHLNPDLLMEAGFVEVGRTEYSLPIHVAEESAGKIWLISCLDAMEACCLRLLTEQLGWDPDKCKAACEVAAREIADMAKDPETSRNLVVKMCVLVGRKPLDALPGSPRSFEMPRSPTQWRSSTWINDDEYRYYTNPTRTEDGETIRDEDEVEDQESESLTS
ncbi:unnamed protein product [Clonostachys byssicola]|uniref:Secondary metabolism regulator LAE1 n=1 Tax=Clonostachys byssicola TaxID=160290 RepID=A0A9N9UU57_9HYPO|nr:unnamed protein product [Clonostachys byssicola]